MGIPYIRVEVLTPLRSHNLYLMAELSSKALKVDRLAGGPTYTKVTILGPVYRSLANG